MPLLNELANGTKNGYSSKSIGQAAAWSLRVPVNKPVSPESAIMAAMVVITDPMAGNPSSEPMSESLSTHATS
jgi:hypothetical protein